MKISRGFALASLMTLAASPVFAQFSLNDAANAVSTMPGTDQSGAAQTTAPQAGGLLSLLGSQLNITPEQAIGGTGAMLGLAKNQLSPTDYSQLSQNLPGLDLLTGAGALGGLSGLSGLLGGQSGKPSALDGLLGGNVQNTNDLNSAFSALGMDTGMIGLFAPVMLQYLGQQGIAGPLLQSLGGIWGMGSDVGSGS